MTPAAEFAFITMAEFVGDASAASSANLLAVCRTLAPSVALGELGYLAAAFSLFSGQGIGADLRAAKAAVFADLRDQPAAAYNAALAGFSGRAFYDLVEAPAPESASERFARNTRVVLTASSEWVARETSGRLGRPVRTIPEPLQGARQIPRAPQARSRLRMVDWLARRAGLHTESWRLRLFWSGEEREIHALLAIWPELAKLGRTLALEVHAMAPAGKALERLAVDLREQEGAGLPATLEPWSPPGVAQALANCDLVLIPDPGPASHSRLLRALHAGRFCVARASPHLGPLADHAWVGEDLVEGIRWSLSHTDQVLDRIGAGQRYLDAVHARDKVARTWVELFHHA